MQLPDYIYDNRDVMAVNFNILHRYQWLSCIIVAETITFVVLSNPHFALFEQTLFCYKLFKSPCIHLSLHGIFLKVELYVSIAFRRLLPMDAKNYLCLSTVEVLLRHRGLAI